MSCETCRAALSAGPGRVGRINQALDGQCGCESFSVSPHSPGIVSDPEILHYLVPTPEGRLENGLLNPSFLVQVDVEGLSVLRDGASDQEFELTVAELRPRWRDKNRVLEGVMSFTAEAVRYESEACRLCCVYDSAMPEKPHHADLMAPELPALSKSQLERQRRARLKMIVDKIGNSFTDARSFRQGRLSHLAQQ